MNAWALAAVLCAATFAVIEFGAWAALSIAGPRRSARRARDEASALFLRGTLPTAAAGLVALAVVAPAFLTFEPAAASEWPGTVLFALAAVGAGRGSVLAWRIARMLLASRRITRTWHGSAVPLRDRAWGLPAFVVETGRPVVAAARLLRSRIYVDRRVLRACTVHELAAIAAHERAHVRRRDNVRKLFVFACAGPSSRLARAWRLAAERAADDDAAPSPARALHLASALVAVTRLSCPSALARTALSPIDDGEAGGIDRRVRRLLARCDDASAREAPDLPGGAVGASRAIFAGLSTAVALASVPSCLRAVHGILELAVTTLP